MEQYESYSESISKFMEWASRKIAEEVANNEEFERQSGVTHPITKRNHLPHYLNDDQKLGYILSVDDLRDKGMGSSNACEKIGIHISTYSQWRKKFGMDKYKIKSKK